MSLNFVRYHLFGLVLNLLSLIQQGTVTKIVSLITCIVSNITFTITVKYCVQNNWYLKPNWVLGTSSIVPKCVEDYFYSIGYYLYYSQFNCVLNSFLSTICFLPDTIEYSHQHCKDYRLHCIQYSTEITRK